MRDFSCFGESGVQIADSSRTGHNNQVTCLYQAQLGGSHSCVITVTWSRSLMGQCISISVDDSASQQSLAKLDIKPWLFSKKKGSKCMDADNNSKFEAFWDLSAARFGSGPEPLEGFYVAIIFDLEMVLLLGDMEKEAYLKTGTSHPPNATLIAKREHLYGKKVYCTKARFCSNGRLHDVVIECDTSGLKEPCLEIRVDRKTVMHVRRLLWKFRGNQTILVGGVPVEVLWDVHSWLFDASAGSCAVFMFQTYLSAQKLLPWSCSQVLGETMLRGLGFSLILFAWKNV